MFLNEILKKINNVTFAITADKGELSKEAFWLVKSIRFNHPSANIVTLIPSKSIESIDDKYLSLFYEKTTVIEEKTSFTNYPILNKLKALKYASERYSSNYYVLLDTDTIVVNPLYITEGYDLYVKPVHYGGVFWGSKLSHPIWKSIYNSYEKRFPTEKIKSTIDNKTILPYYNAGVVITNSESMINKWFCITKKLYENADNIGIPDNSKFFCDQVALPVASADMDVKLLSEIYNFPLLSRPYCPDNVKVIHYHNIGNISLISNETIIKKLEKIGVPKEKNVSSIMINMRRLYNILIGQTIFKYIPYQIKKGIHILSPKKTLISASKKIKEKLNKGIF